MATYAEYLKSQGASEEEIKILATPTAERIWEKTEARIVAIAKERDDAKASAVAYQERADEWYKTEKDNLAAAKSAATTAAAEAARYRASLLALHKQGMIDLAKDAGFKPEELEGAPVGGGPGGTPNPPVPGTTPFDSDKYTREVLLPLAEREGDAIALVQDIAFEHATLFPGQPVNFRSLREEAKKRNLTVEAVWMERFKVPEARAAAEKKRADAHDEEIRKAERERVTSELTSRFANPETRPLGTSNSPFAPRPEGTTRSGKQPWQLGENHTDQLADDRVRRATQKVLSTAVH